MSAHRLTLQVASRLIAPLFLAGFLFASPSSAQNFIAGTTKIVPEKAATKVGQAVANLGSFFDARDETQYIAIGEPDAEGGGAVWIGALDESGGFATKTPAIRIPAEPGDFDGLEEDDRFGFSIAPVGDLDGNGIQELAIGAPGDDDAGTNAGAVWIVYLDAGGKVLLTTKFTEDDVEAQAATNFGEFGHAVAGVTGIAQENQGILIASNSRGKVYGCFTEKGGIFGCASTNSGDEELSDDMDFGSGIVQMGPPGVNGFTPLAIGAPRYVVYEEPGGPGYVVGGIYFYSIRGVNNAISFTRRSEYGSIQNSSMGASLAAPGDLDGDGCADLIAGGPQFFTGGFAPGYIYFIYMNCSLSNPQPIAVFSDRLDPQDSPSTVLRGGTSLAISQPPGKDDIDLLVGAPNDTEAGENRGAIHYLSLFHPLPPLALDDVVTMTEDVPKVLSALFNNDRLNDLAPHTARTGISFGGQGQLDPTSISTDESFTYTPPADFFGEITISYRLGDTRFISIFDSPYTFARVRVTVFPAEDTPRITTPELLVAPIGDLYNQEAIANEVDNDSMTVTVLKKPDWLAVAMSGYAAETKIQLIGTPSADDAGEHEIIIFADDGKGTDTQSFIITVPSEALATPQLVVPENGALDQPLDVTTTWTAIDGATSYIAQLSPAADFSTDITQKTGSETQAVFEGLNPETVYHWRVQAVGDQAASEFSSAFSFTTEQATGVLATPGLVSPEDGALDQPLDMTMTWLPVDGASSYVVQVSASVDFSADLAQTTVAQTQATFDGLDPETEYFWRVQALSDEAVSAFSEAFSFTTGLNLSGVANEDPAGLFEDALDQNYPNPFTHSTTVSYQIAQPGPVRLYVFDMLGREVARVVDEVQPAGRYEAKIRLEDLPNGVYLYEFRAGKYSAVRRMVLLR